MISLTMISKRIIQVGNPAVYIISRPVALCGRFQSSKTEHRETRHQVYEELEKPKQPLKPFIRFLMKYRSLFAAKYPDAGMYELYNRIASVWFQQNANVKRQYYDEYWNEAQVYYEEAEKFKNIDSEEKTNLLESKKKKRNKLREKRQKRLLEAVIPKPKRAKNAFLMYLMEKYSGLERTTNGAPINVKELSRLASAEWRSMSQEDKKTYEDQSAKLSKEYKKEMELWECQVIKRGFAHMLPKDKFFDLRPTVRDRRVKMVNSTTENTTPWSS